MQRAECVRMSKGTQEGKSKSLHFSTRFTSNWDEGVFRNTASFRQNSSEIKSAFIGDVTCALLNSTWPLAHWVAYGRCRPRLFPHFMACQLTCTHCLGELGRRSIAAAVETVATRGKPNQKQPVHRPPTTCIRKQTMLAGACHRFGVAV